VRQLDVVPESMSYDDNYYRNCLLCAVKIAVSLGADGVFDGRLLLIDSSIPTFQKLGTSLAMVTAIVLALLADVSDMQNDSVWLPLQPSRLAKRIASKFTQIKPANSLPMAQLELQLGAYFGGKAGSLFFRRPEKINEEEDEYTEFVTKELPSDPRVLYMETIPGASKMKENISRIKTILEYRIFLRALGLKDVAKPITITQAAKLIGHSLEDLRIALKEQFDNKSYTKSNIEETMDLECIELISDIPYAVQVLESIFALNPFQ
jgi:hypothetical protein